MERPSWNKTEKLDHLMLHKTKVTELLSGTAERKEKKEWKRDC